jgi:hypothetical protein
MIKKKIGIIGHGKWGKIISNQLLKLTDVKFILRSKDNYKDYIDNIDWVFILTPDDTHYQITKFYLKKKINVFCEKPLCLKAYQGRELINLSKKNKVKLYINDIETYKKKKIFINKKINYIVRKKKDIPTSFSLIDRLAYHDFYLLNKYIDLKSIKSIKGIISKTKLDFTIILKNNTIFKFYYDISSKNKKHLINQTKFHLYKNNPLKLMIKSILYSKKNNLRINNQNALDCINLISKVKNSLNRI